MSICDPFLVDPPHCSPAPCPAWSSTCPMEQPPPDWAALLLGLSFARTSTASNAPSRQSPPCTTLLYLTWVVRAVALEDIAILMSLKLDASASTQCTPFVDHSVSVWTTTVFTAFISPVVLSCPSAALTEVIVDVPSEFFSVRAGPTCLTVSDCVAWTAHPCLHRDTLWDSTIPCPSVPPVMSICDPFLVNAPHCSSMLGAVRGSVLTCIVHNMLVWWVLWGFHSFWFVVGALYLARCFARAQFCSSVCV